jgi:curved DNA-binding protein CbpA
MRDPRRDEGLDLYEILEVSPKASQEVIQAAYRVLARNAHPDRNTGAEAEQRIRQINAAYEVLSEPAQRARYDLELARARRRERQLASAAAEAGAPQRPSAGHTRVRVLPARQAVVRARADTGSGVSFHTIVMLFAVAAAAAILAVFVWMTIDAATSDEKIVPQPQPVFTRPLMDQPARLVDQPGR